MTRTALLDGPTAPTAPTALDDLPAGVAAAIAALVTYQERLHRSAADQLGLRLHEVVVDVETGGDHEVRFSVGLLGPEPAERYDALRAAVAAHAPVLDLVTGPRASPVPAVLAADGGH